MTTETETVSLDETYMDISQEEAGDLLADQGALMLAWDIAIANGESKKIEVGRCLNTIHENGLAVAAGATIDSGDRSWSQDGRKTTVSAFAEKYLPTVGTKKVSDWRKMARTFDSLEEQEVNTTKFAPSAFLALLADADVAEFVAVVQQVADEHDGTVTAAEFVKAGRKAGIVAQPPERTPAPKLSDLETSRQPVMAPLALLIPALKDAIANGVGFNKTQRGAFATAQELLAELEVTSAS